MEDIFTCQSSTAQEQLVKLMMALFYLGVSLNQHVQYQRAGTCKRDATINNAISSLCLTSQNVHCDEEMLLCCKNEDLLRSCSVHLIKTGS